MEANLGFRGRGFRKSCGVIEMGVVCKLRYWQLGFGLTKGCSTTKARQHGSLVEALVEVFLIL